MSADEQIPEYHVTDDALVDNKGHIVFLLPFDINPLVVEKQRYVIKAANLYGELLSAATAALDKLELVNIVNINETGEEVPATETEQLKAILEKAKNRNF